jgi:hypothetical protein
MWQAHGINTWDNSYTAGKFAGTRMLKVIQKTTKYGKNSFNQSKEIPYTQVGEHIFLFKI